MTLLNNNRKITCAFVCVLWGGVYVKLWSIGRFQSSVNPISSNQEKMDQKKWKEWKGCIVIFQDMNISNF